MIPFIREFFSLNPVVTYITRPGAVAMNPVIICNGVVSTAHNRAELANCMRQDFQRFTLYAVGAGKFCCACCRGQ
jgi:hypothetical protein